MSTKTRFEKEAWGNSEMAYWTLFLCKIFLSFFFQQTNMAIGHVSEHPSFNTEVKYNRITLI